MADDIPEADICLCLEGTYPYVFGGVSTWVHELIKAQSHLTFYLVCILPLEAPTISCYEHPDNVIGITNIHLQKIPEGVRHLSKQTAQRLFQSVELPLLHLQSQATQDSLKQLIHALNEVRRPVGSRILLNSEDAWKMLLRMYRSSIGGGQLS